MFSSESKSKLPAAPRPVATMPGQQKTCGTCRRQLPLSDYVPKKTGKYGVEAHCRQCRNEKNALAMREIRRKAGDRKQGVTIQ